MRPIPFVLPLILVVACKDDPKPSVSQTATESFSQVPATSADILWVVDNSISMQEEQFKVMDGASTGREGSGALGAGLGARGLGAGAGAGAGVWAFGGSW